MKEKVLRVSAYARVSTDKDDQINSLISQRDYFTEYIKNHANWKLTQIYYDEGVSGTQTKKRIGFQQMIQDALNGEIDLVLTKEVCRFARNTVDTLSYTRMLKEANVGVVFTIDNIDTRDCDGELRLTIMASIAQEESRKTSERVKWGQKRRMEQGVVFGRDLLGYKVQNGKLFINEEEAFIVKKIFHKYTNEGKGTHVIARELREEGIQAKRGTLWSNTMILRVLRNEKYVGDLLQQKTFTPNYLTHKKKYNHGEEEMVYLENHHEAIIDKDLWERTQEELKRRSPSDEQKSRHSNRYWCSGKLHCALCGNRFVSRTRKLKNGNLYKAWRCYATANHGRKKIDSNGMIIGCDNSSINERALCDCMNYSIMLVQKEKNTLKQEILQEIQQVQAMSPQKADSQKIRKKIEILENKRRKAIDLMLEGIISKEDFKNQTDWYNEETEHLNQQLAAAVQECKASSQQINVMEQYIAALDEIVGTDSYSELIYKEVLDHMDIHKDKIIDIWLKGIPVGIRLKIKTSGHREFFKTEILETSFIKK